MKNLNYLNKYRIDVFSDGNVGDEYNGAFRIFIKNAPYLIIASNGCGWEHVSVSHKKNTPSWEVMCEIKNMFFYDEEVVIQFHPKKSEYVNNHEHCLHLWRPLQKEIPTPPSILVGLK